MLWKGEPMELIDRRDAIRIVDSIDTWQAGWRGDAIESLKALPSAQPEPCEDAVSRTDVIDLYKRGAERIAKVKGMSVEELPHRGLDVLMNLPSVMPVRDCKGCRFKFLPERKEDNADAIH